MTDKPTKGPSDDDASIPADTASKKPQGSNTLMDVSQCWRTGQLDLVTRAASHPMTTSLGNEVFHADLNHPTTNLQQQIIDALDTAQADGQQPIPAHTPVWNPTDIDNDGVADTLPNGQPGPDVHPGVANRSQNLLPGTTVPFACALECAQTPPTDTNGNAVGDIERVDLPDGRAVYYGVQLEPNAQDFNVVGDDGGVHSDSVARPDCEPTDTGGTPEDKATIPADTAGKESKGVDKNSPEMRAALKKMLEELIESGDLEMRRVTEEDIREGKVGADETVIDGAEDVVNIILGPEKGKAN